MKTIFVAVYDKATEAYMRPWMAQSDGQAVRLFEDEMNREDSEVGKHPEDYSLFRIGSFNDNNGALEGQEPVCLRRAHEIHLGIPNKAPVGGIASAGLERTG